MLSRELVPRAWLTVQLPGRSVGHLGLHCHLCHHQMWKWALPCAWPGLGELGVDSASRPEFSCITSAAPGAVCQLLPCPHLTWPFYCWGEKYPLRWNGVV